MSPGPGHIAAKQCQYRDAVRPGDRESVRAIVAATGFFSSSEIDVAVELVDEHLARGTASGYQFVFADLESGPAGYACYGPIPCTTASFDLYWIAVDPQYQRHGVGRGLISVVESRITSAGGERIYIDTSGRRQYAPTRAFYERSGFRCDATLRDFYAPSDDRVIYVKVVSH
jgi:GNAT superfamily N-acetyltransferase